MIAASELRLGNIIRVDGKVCKILEHEIRGTGRFGKTVHVKLKSLSDGNILEKSWRAEEKVEDIEFQRVKMQYLYREGDQLMFMNMETYEQFSVSAKGIGRQAAFLKENMEMDVEFAEGKPVSIALPKIVGIKVVNAPAPVKGGGDSTYKEVELENGLQILVPQFIKEGETIRVDTEHLAYVDRVTTKSL